MAEPYLTQLSQMLESLEIPGVTFECKHFFSGAALYAKGKICASLGPVGFAVKLPEIQRRGLISDGKEEQFRFFPDGPVKREYVLVSEYIIQDENEFQEILGMSVSYVLGAAE